jgi:hypothetical protein
MNQKAYDTTDNSSNYSITRDGLEKLKHILLTTSTE